MVVCGSAVDGSEIRLYNQLKWVVLSQHLQGSTYINPRCCRMFFQSTVWNSTIKTNNEETKQIYKHHRTGTLELVVSVFHPTHFLVLPTPWSFRQPQPTGTPPCLSLPSSRDPNRPAHLLPLGPGTSRAYTSNLFRAEMTPSATPMYFFWPYL